MCAYQAGHSEYRVFTDDDVVAFLRVASAPYIRFLTDLVG